MTFFTPLVAETHRNSAVCLHPSFHRIKSDGRLKRLLSWTACHHSAALATIRLVHRIRSIAELSAVRESKDRERHARNARLRALRGFFSDVAQRWVGLARVTQNQIGMASMRYHQFLVP